MYGLGAARGQRSREGPSASYPARIGPSSEAVVVEVGQRNRVESRHNLKFEFVDNPEGRD
jgi:hypothetical protein